MAEIASTINISKTYSEKIEKKIDEAYLVKHKKLEKDKETLQ